MPLYEYRCDTCGTFDERRPSTEATAPLDCPGCAGPARRVYTPPGGHSRVGLLGAAGGRDRARLGRALTGEPTVTGRPAGTRLPSAPHAH